jgi:HAD superfamily hydrolase (TIGR01509 family)
MGFDIYLDNGNSFKLSGAIFDLDGTLIDSMHIWNSAGAEYIKRVGKTPEDGIWIKLQPMTTAQTAEYICKNYGVNVSPADVVEDLFRIIADFYTNEVLPKEGAIDFLELLRLHGVKMCIATATDRHLVDAALKKCGLMQYFKAILTCTEVGVSKMQPDIFNQALSAIGTPKSETLVFEDAYFAVLTLKKAGFTVAAVYDEPSESFWAETKALADLQIDSFTRLMLTFRNE